MQRQPMPDLIVVIPGITGSTLVDKGGAAYWSMGARQLLPMLARLAVHRDRLRLPSDIGDGPANDGIMAGSLMPDLHSIPGVWTIDGYDKLLSGLRARFDLTDAMEGRPGNLLAFAHDWRLSNRYNGRLLAEVARRRLEEWRTASANRNSRLVLICHSMSGLIARWFLDVEGGHQSCRMLITIGTPFQGAPKAISALVNGVDRGLGPLRLRLNEIVRSLPSVHQLVPAYPCLDPGEHVLVQPAESTVPMLTTEAARDAALFHQQLAGAGRKTAGSYPIYALKGHIQPTSQVAVVDGSGVILDDLEHPRHRYQRPRKDGQGLEEVVNVRGDGTVPRASSHPGDWLSEEQRPERCAVQGFAPMHAHLQNADALADSLFQILTQQRLGQTAGGRMIGVDAPEVIREGESFPIAVVGATSNPPLMAIVDGNMRHAVDLENLGEGRYRGEIPGLSLDTHTITIVSRAPRNPVEPIDTLVTVTSDTELKRLVDQAAETR